MKAVRIAPLKGANSFDAVFSSGLRFGTRHCLLVVVPVDKDEVKRSEPHTLFVGVVARKKLFKRAVLRNRVKRLLRESIRALVASGVYSQSLLECSTCVLLWNSVPKEPMLLQQSFVQEELEKCLVRWQKSLNKQSTISE